MGAGRGRSPWLVDVVDLRRHLGERRPIVVEGTTSTLAVADSSVAAGTVIRLDGELESIPAGVACTARLSTSWAGPCRRCLRGVEGLLEVPVAEVFVRDHVEGETYPLGHDRIDLEPLVRDAVLLSLPTAPLCGEDCPGPDPEAFPVGSPADPADAGGEGGEGPVDPRWAGLEAARRAVEEPGHDDG